MWSRLADFQPEALSRLIQDRSAVRIALMRSTLHLVTARDCLALRPVLQSVHERALKGTFGKHLNGLDIEALAAAGRKLVETQPRTFSELGMQLAEQWPNHEPAALAAAVRTIVPLVQVPPRGLWGVSGQASHTSAEVWLGQSLAANTSPDDMVLRYLAAFGPATIKDIQVWSGLTKLREVIERLRPHLHLFLDEQGSELFDLPDAPLPDAGTEAPVRFLAEFDNMLLSYANRTRILADKYRPRVFTQNGIIHATLLIDGFVSGTWKIEKKADTTILIIEPFTLLSSKDQVSLIEEGTRLLIFAAAGAPAHDIQIIPPQ
ncbi:winged helix DNA-binding domain-containing protein [Paenibacillus sp. SYP-B3998]|uniref:winged helix DNA-binding domain-containing protein n=1 Tax=Paenibacillus sp. SYP-B3998 TaxID=2678564 RepID=UPI0031F91B39